jgi:hypothetical protein
VEFERVAHGAARQHASIAAELGMTPSVRTAIRVGDDAPAEPLTAFLQGRDQAPWDDAATACARAVAEGRILRRRGGSGAVRCLETVIIRS